MINKIIDKCKKVNALTITYGLLLISSIFLFLTQYIFYNIIVYVIVGIIGYIAFDKKVLKILLGLFLYTFSAFLVIFSLEYGISSIIANLYGSAVYSLVFNIFSLMGIGIVHFFKETLKKEKTTMTSRVLTGIVCIIISVAVIYISNTFVGNVVSRIIVNVASNNYIEKQYNSNFYVEDINYSFKDGSYIVVVNKDDSIDSHFMLTYNLFGKLESNNYEDVTSGYNTYHRINMEYYDLFEEEIKKASFYSEKLHQYASLEILGNDYFNKYIENEYGIVLSDLLLDEEYDVVELGKLYGNVTITMENDVINEETLKEKLLLVANELEYLGITYHTINLIIKNENDTMELNSFFVSDISADNLSELITKNIEDYNNYIKEVEN